MATPFHCHLCYAFNFLFAFCFFRIGKHLLSASCDYICNASLRSAYMLADPIEFSACYIVEHVSMLEMYK